MSKITFIVERLNEPPFSKGFATFSDLDSKSPLDILEILCEVIVFIDPDQTALTRETPENRVQIIMQFLSIMKFQIPEGQGEYFQSLLISGDKNVLFDVIYWCLERLDHLQKRAYLAKYLFPLEIPAEFMSDDRVQESLQRYSELQSQFKEIHKIVDQYRSRGTRPAELKAAIQQLETEKTQITNKIQRLEKGAHADDPTFREMLKVFVCTHF